MDLLYKVDGRILRALNGWHLQEGGRIHMLVGETTPRGLYHIIGLRASGRGNEQAWIKVDARILVR